MVFVRRMEMKRLAFVLAVVMTGQAAMAGMAVTEWMYKGYQYYDSGNREGEFIEFTNLGSTAIDMTGWSFDDGAAVPGAFDLSVFGVVAPGESVILTEAGADEFKTSWGLGSEIKIIGDLGNPNGNNLGRGDVINLYDSGNNLVDTLIYDDEEGWGLRTREYSCSIPFSDLSLQTATDEWGLAYVGDDFGSWQALSGDIGSPGSYVPEPATLALLGLGGLALRRRIHR